MDAHEYFPLKISLFVYQVHYILFLYKVQQKHDHHTFALINLCNQMLCNEKCTCLTLIVISVSEWKKKTMKSDPSEIYGVFERLNGLSSCIFFHE